MDRVSSARLYEGQVFTVRKDVFRNPDGSEREREIVDHPGAVAVVAHDEERFWMVRQPREAVGEEALLELPAGKLDVEGESPLECAQRELEEETGKRAAEWREVKRTYTSPGFADEEVTIFFATGIEDGRADPGEDEDIEVVEVPLPQLDETIAVCRDAKSLIGLLLFAAERDSG